MNMLEYVEAARQQHLRNIARFGDHEDWEILYRVMSEELGEFVGAMNKWIDKQGTAERVREEAIDVLSVGIAMLSRNPMAARTTAEGVRRLTNDIDFASIHRPLSLIDRVKEIHRRMGADEDPCEVVFAILIDFEQAVSAR